MRSFLLFLSFSSMFFFRLSAQDEKVIYVQKAPRGSNYKQVSNDLVVKIDPINLLSKEINVGVEKRISRMSSLELDAGPTLYGLSLSLSGLHYYYSYSERGGLGLFAGLGYRYYVLDNNQAPNRLYIGPYTKYSLFNYTAHDFSGHLGDKKSSWNRFYGGLMIGWQHWFSSHFSLDFYGSVGISQETRIDYRVESDYNYGTGSYAYTWNRNVGVGNRIYFLGGVKIGIGMITGKK